MKRQLENLFGKWQAKQGYQRIPNLIKQVRGERLALNTPDKTSSFLLSIHPINMNDQADMYPAFLMANHMLGGGALRSRLADRIRQKEGLSYAVGSFASVPAHEPVGMWAAYAMSAPQNVGKVEAALREELQLVLKEGFTEAELSEAKKAWRQSEEVTRSQDSGLASLLSTYLSLNRTLQFDKALETKVAALNVKQVNQAIREFIQVENLSIIAAGDQSKTAQ